MNFILAALSLGFLGSFHCVGMCGPIALALPLDRSSVYSRISGALLYNLGRTMTYTLIGLLFGLLGYGIVISGLQQAVSVILGTLIILTVLFHTFFSQRLNAGSFIYGGIARLKSKLGELLRKKSLSSLFLIGSLNGLLPCGLVYLGIAGAIASGDGLQGSMFMLMFGLGTIPAMFILTMISHRISAGFRSKIRKAMPVVIAGMGLMLILRGMNLGIPYLSPEMSGMKPECHKCCNK